MQFVDPGLSAEPKLVKEAPGMELSFRALNKAYSNPRLVRSKRQEGAENVSFLVNVEPLLLGIIPESLLPLIVFLLATTAAVGWLAHGVVLPRVSRLADEVVAEICLLRDSERKSN